jgi:hypothetical protein
MPAHLSAHTLPRTHACVTESVFVENSGIPFHARENGVVISGAASSATRRERVAKTPVVSTLADNEYDDGRAGWVGARGNENLRMSRSVVEREVACG